MRSLSGSDEAPSNVVLDLEEVVAALGLVGLTWLDRVFGFLPMVLFVLRVMMRSAGMLIINVRFPYLVKLEGTTNTNN